MARQRQARPGDLHLAADIAPSARRRPCGSGRSSRWRCCWREQRQSGGADCGSGPARSGAIFARWRRSASRSCSPRGLVNTWFLAGTVPALIGTEYGRLLLAKIALFATMVTFAAVNLLRMTPVGWPPIGGDGADRGAALGHLRRNAFVEAGARACAFSGSSRSSASCRRASHRARLAAAVPPRSRGADQLGAELPGGFVAAAVLATLLALPGAACRPPPDAIGSGEPAAVSLFVSPRAGCRCGPAIEPAYPTSFYAPAEPTPRLRSRAARASMPIIARCAMAPAAGATAPLPPTWRPVRPI